MILPDYKKLFEPYTGSDSTVEAMIAWLRKTSGAQEEIISLSVRNLFTELAGGKTFPTDMCQCGCEMKVAHAAINHYLLKETLKLKNAANRRYWSTLEKFDHERIIKYVETARGANKKIPLKYKISQWFKRIPVQDNNQTPMGM